MKLLKTLHFQESLVMKQEKTEKSRERGSSNNYKEFRTQVCFKFLVLIPRTPFFPPTDIP